MITPFSIYAPHPYSTLSTEAAGPCIVPPTGGAHGPETSPAGEYTAPHCDTAFNDNWVRPAGLANPATYPYLAPPASPSGAGAWDPRMRGVLPWHPHVYAAPDLPLQMTQHAAAADVRVQGGQDLGSNGPFDEQEALLTFGPALRELGLTQADTQRLVAAPRGPWDLAMLSQYLPLLHGCGFTNEALTSAVSHALGPLNIQILGEYAPALRHLGWSEADILHLATTPSGAQGLAELVGFGPELLRRGFYHQILASCAQTPGCLQMLLAMQSTDGEAQSTSAVSPLHTAPVENHCVSGRAIVPIEFSAAELGSLVRIYRGSDRVAALKQFSGMLDSTLIDRGAVLALACVPNGDKQLNEAFASAPAFAELGFSLDKVFAVLVRRDGAKTLKTLLRVSPYLYALNLDAAMQMKLATRMAGSDILEVVMQHGAHILALGWTPEQLVSLSCLPRADKNLPKLRRMAPPLHALGFSASQLLIACEGGHGGEALSAMGDHGPRLLCQGFSFEQVASIASQRLGGLKLQKLEKFAKPLLAHGFGPAALTQMAMQGEGMMTFKKLLACCKHKVNGLPAEVLLRAALLEGSDIILAAIDKNWQELAITSPQAAYVLSNELSRSPTASSFERWLHSFLAAAK